MIHFGNILQDKTPRIAQVFERPVGLVYLLGVARVLLSPLYLIQGKPRLYSYKAGNDDVLVIVEGEVNTPCVLVRLENIKKEIRKKSRLAYVGLRPDDVKARLHSVDIPLEALKLRKGKAEDFLRVSVLLPPLLCVDVVGKE